MTATTTVTVTPGGGGVGNPQIIRFEGSPLSIQPGQQSTLSWTTTGATQVSISGVGSVTLNGSTTVSPAQTTTYTLSATSGDGKTVTAPITITVASGNDPAGRGLRGHPHHHRCRQFYQAVLAGDGRHRITIKPGVGTNLTRTIARRSARPRPPPTPSPRPTRLARFRPTRRSTSAR